MPSEPDPTGSDAPGPDAPSRVSGALAAVPGRWRPRAALVLGSRLGHLALDTGGELLRVQIFDRAMTLAAQAFTSLLPLLIMVAALLGPHARDRLTDALGVSDSSRRLLQEALSGSRSGAFGVLGGLVVVVSATSLTRALTRAYAVTWSMRPRLAGAAATGRQVLTVLALSGFVMGGRLLGRLAGELPAPRLAAMAVTALADAAVALALPVLLLGRAARRAHPVTAAILFGAVMVGVRAAGSVYLPRALRHSTEQYGTIGLAFTYLGWLYAISFCLLLTAVLGRVLGDALARERPRPSRRDR